MSSNDAITIFVPATGERVLIRAHGSQEPGLGVILSEQHARERTCSAADRAEVRLRCCCTEDSSAAFVVHRVERGEVATFYLTRMPRTSERHAEHCYARHRELPAPRAAEGQNTPRRGDLSALLLDRADPELQRRERAASRYSPSSSGRSSSGPSAGLGSLGTLLLRGAELDHWKPTFRGRRDFRVVHGLLSGALDALLRQVESPYAVLLKGAGKEVGWGSWTNVCCRSLRKVLAFGFVTGDPSRNERGSLVLRIGFGCSPLVFASSLVDQLRASRAGGANLELPTYPTLLLFVAERFGQEWKAHRAVAFRLSRIGLLPIESEVEERMVEHLIASGRAFRRVLPAPGEHSKMRPDFELTDTSGAPRFIEVAGSSLPDYQEHLHARIAAWGDSVAIWHAYRGEEISSVQFAPVEGVRHG